MGEGGRDGVEEGRKGTQKGRYARGPRYGLRKARSIAVQERRGGYIRLFPVDGRDLSRAVLPAGSMNEDRLFSWGMWLNRRFPVGPAGARQFDPPDRSFHIERPFELLDWRARGGNDHGVIFRGHAP